MDNYSFNSYPESGNSSPQSREFDFENPPPWDDQYQPAESYKAKFMCSYGGKIQPRPHDNQLSYIGGETKILAVDHTTKFSSMISKLNALYGGGDEVSFKYQLPGEDLDALISVTNDDDLDHMMHEYDRVSRASAKPARMRLFIFPANNSSSFGSEGSKSERGRFVEALNSGPASGGEKQAVIPQSKVDFLFGIEKGMPESQSPQIQIRDHVAEPMNPPPPTLQEVVGPDHVLNPIEFQRQLQNLQRVQIREQEQLAMYRKNAEDAAAAVAASSMVYTNTGEYYAQKIPEKVPPLNVPVTFQQHVQATSGFWSDKPISVGGFPATVTTNTCPRPPSEHPVYMIQAPGPGQTTVYATPQAVKVPMSATSAPQMVRAVPGQAYYTNVQRMPHDVYREQHVYNMMAQAQAQQPPPAQHPPIYGMQQQMVRSPSSGTVSDVSYAQMAAAYDRQPVYYTAPAGSVMMQPQFQGVSGEMRRGSGGEGSEGKTGNKVPQASV